MYQQILHFWFREVDPSQWWSRNDALDRLIIERFSDLHTQARHCELYEWRSSAQGRLAEIIVIDQFSRNMFRNSPLAFANDHLALALSQEAIASGANTDTDLSAQERVFLYLPFMHSESRKIHERAVELFGSNGLQANLDFELKHKAIIDRFGRYPHRNSVLGRTSTVEEIEFLKQPDSAF